MLFQPATTRSKVDPGFKTKIEDVLKSRKPKIMSETKKRKVHTPEYKAKVAIEALRSDKTINQIGQEFDVHPVQVGLWKRAVQEQAKTLFQGKRGPKPVDAQSEPDRLYSEIGRLKMELDWLKKKSGMSLS
jgi:transposase-like protein